MARSLQCLKAISRSGESNFAIRQLNHVRRELTITLDKKCAGLPVSDLYLATATLTRCIDIVGCYEYQVAGCNRSD